VLVFQAPVLLHHWGVAGEVGHTGESALPVYLTIYICLILQGFFRHCRREPYVDFA
jgi:hypothetical protein